MLRPFIFIRPTPAQARGARALSADASLALTSARCNADVKQGGALLGQLDPAREHWLRQAEWLAGGVRAGPAKRPREYNTAVSVTALMLHNWVE